MPSESTATIIHRLVDSPTQTDQEIITLCNSSFQETLRKKHLNKANIVETNEWNTDDVMHGSTIERRHSNQLFSLCRGLSN